MKVVRILATALAVATPLAMAAAADIPVEGAVYEPRPVALIFRWTGVYTPKDFELNRIMVDLVRIVEHGTEGAQRQRTQRE